VLVGEGSERQHVLPSLVHERGAASLGVV
jgi:hypothetical protein